MRTPPLVSRTCHHHRPARPAPSGPSPSERPTPGTRARSGALVATFVGSILLTVLAQRMVQIRNAAGCQTAGMNAPSDLLAVLVDADNVPPSRIGAVLTEVARFGTASVKRVYGDWTTTQLKSWKGAASEHVIQPMQQFAHTKGKNSTDSALIIDAMDLLYTGRFQGFCIVSSDSDFTRLASRIREQGITVYGFGERKTPTSFRNACDQFTYLDVLGMGDGGTASAELTPKRPETASPLDDARLMEGLRNSVRTASSEDGWANLASVGQLLRKWQSDFDSRNWGYAKLSELVRATGQFTVDGYRVRWGTDPQ